jgi:hypothetical protein
MTTHALFGQRWSLARSKVKQSHLSLEGAHGRLALRCRQHATFLNQRLAAWAAESSLETGHAAC